MFNFKLRFMDRKIFSSALSEGGLDYKIKMATKFLYYYLRLNFGVLTNQIYFKPNKNNSTVLSFDFNELLKEFDGQITDFLEKNSLGNIIDVKQKIGFEHLGYGCFVTRIFDQLSLISQGNATFFFDTKPNNEYKIRIILQSFAKLTVEIKFENKIIGNLSIPSLSEKEVILNIPSSLINKKVSKLEISTDKLWSLKYLDKEQFDVPLGIGIKKIELLNYDD